MVDWKSIQEKAGPYPLAAYAFVREGLEHTTRMVHGAEDAEQDLQLAGEDEQPEADPAGSGRHVTGQQLCLGLKEYALRKYGRLARMVLDRWSIRRTDDFGRIVFAMIDAGLMRRTEADTLQDFIGVYEFDEVFDAAEN
ncbi:MAG: hypothetical protein R3B68_16995 [Phycisphaerales bacterium]